MKNRPGIKQSLVERYDCGPVKLFGDAAAFYERHVTFDQVVASTEATARDKFEAIARSARDVLSQRWLKTEQTYRQRDAKRVYYLPMEFLLGRMLANNITSLLLDEQWRQFCRQHELESLEIIEQEPDAGLGNGGLGRLAACFLDSMATLAIPGMGYGLRYEYGIFRQSLRDGWQAEQPDHWLARPDPWEVPRPDEAVEVKLNCSFEIRSGALRVVEGRPSSLIGIPYDRPVIGYGGRTINTLRLWAAQEAELLRLRPIQQRGFRRRRRKPSPLRPSRACCIPTITPRQAKVCDFSRNTFSSPVRLPISSVVFALPAMIGRRWPTRWPFNSTTRIRPWPSRS